MPAIYKLFIIVLLVPLPSTESVWTLQNLYKSTKQFLNLAPDPGSDRNSTTQYLIQKRGYSGEVHYVTTEDGYILELHRITNGSNPRRQLPKDSSRFPILLLHGNSQSSADWVANYPVEDSLGFYLADSNYDVWLYNQRGNGNSDKHVNLTTSQSKYWHFSVHELGIYDIPAMVDYITELTSHKKLSCIGFSLSNAAILVALAKKPEYNEKIAGAVLMGPAGIYYEGFVYGIPSKMAPFIKTVLETTIKLFGDMPTVLPIVTNFMHSVLSTMCQRHIDIFGVCLFLFQGLIGHSKELITQDQLSMITSISPTVFPMRLVVHGLQQAKCGKFVEYDYGVKENKLIYGQPNPPKYNLSNVQIPIAIMVGSNDFLASPIDAQILKSKLPKVIDFHFVENEHFRHLNFCYAKGASTLVYSKVVSYLDSFVLEDAAD